MRLGHCAILVSGSVNLQPKGVKSTIIGLAVGCMVLNLDDLAISTQQLVGLVSQPATIYTAAE